MGTPNQTAARKANLAKARAARARKKAVDAAVARKLKGGKARGYSTKFGGSLAAQHMGTRYH